MNSLDTASKPLPTQSGRLAKDSPVRGICTEKTMRPLEHCLVGLPRVTRRFAPGKKVASIVLPPFAHPGRVGVTV